MFTCKLMNNETVKFPGEKRTSRHWLTHPIPNKEPRHEVS